VIDIVDRLRSVRAAKPFGILEHTAQEAADTIELLRAELQNAYDLTKTLTAERDEARRECDRLARRNTILVADIEALASAINKATATTGLRALLYRGEG
jgi:FtsZ-binding cell division protein ZapB